MEELRMTSEAGTCRGRMGLPLFVAFTPLIYAVAVSIPIMVRLWSTLAGPQAYDDFTAGDIT
jgi:hypothetical protein